MKCIVLALASAVLLHAAGAAVCAQESSPATSWELSPYRIHLLVAVDSGGTLPPRLANELPADLAAQATAAAGGAWRVQARAAPAELRQSLLENISALDAKSLPSDALAGDKVLLLAVSEQPDGFRVSARELDVATGLWNSTVTREVPQPAQIPAAALRALLAAFAPLGRIESAEGGVATLKLRGGALVRPGRGSPLVAAGTIFRPVLVKSGQPEATEQIPWTLLVATSAMASEAKCSIQTGLAGEAIPAYHPQRPRWALGVAASGGSTRLKLVAAGSDNAPLEGCQVLAATGGAAGSPASEKLIGTSDAGGLVSIPSGGTTSLMLVIRQGQEQLARVPLVPGLAAEVSLSLPDDRERLQIEASLQEVHDGLLDAAARRESLVARAKLATKAGDTAAADQLKQQLGALAGLEPLAKRLDQAAAAVKNAQPRAGASLQPRLDALRKAIDTLAAEKPLERLEEPKPEEPKAEETKAPKT